MQCLAIITVILATQSAVVPRATNWGLPQLKNIIPGREPHVDSHLMHCLNVAYDNYLKDLNKEPHAVRITAGTSTTDKSTKTTVPPAQVKPAWNFDELVNAALTIMDVMLAEDDTPTTTTSKPNATSSMLQEIHHYVEVITPASGKVPRSASDLLSTNVMNTLHAIMVEAERNISNAREGLKVPMLHVSIWSANDLHDTLKHPGSNDKLVPYLKLALLEPTHFLDDGKKFCVITPVNVIPIRKNDFYVPMASKRLLSQIKNTKTRSGRIFW